MQTRLTDEPITIKYVRTLAALLQ